MELMEIIKSSLSIFSAISFVFILTSYTIYKIKDRSRIKPYLRVNMQSNKNDLIIEEIVHEKKIIPIVQNEEKQLAVQLIQSPVQNELLSRQAMEIRMPLAHERFKIVNLPVTAEQNNIFKPNQEILRPTKKIKLNNKNKNIYEFYSESNEKMHKLKLAVR